MMPLTCTGLPWRSFRGRALCMALLLLLAGCASTGDTILTVDGRHVKGIQYLPTEISSMLEELGYKWLPITDPSIGKVKIAEQFGQYRMQFQAVDDARVRIDVNIRKDNNVSGFHFYEIGSKTLSAPSAEYYQKLKERLNLQFGADNVSDRRSILTP